MRVLVLGGTGAMGRHLVPLLVNRNVETFVTSRKKRIAENSVNYIQGDAHNLIFLKALLKKHWDVIIDFMVYKTPEFKERIDLLLAATSRYIFISSARVYSGSESLLTEDSPRLLDVSDDKKFLLTDEYSLTKARQENLLKDSGRKNWTVIRPYITYSENRLQLGTLEKEGWLYRALKGRTIVFSKDICTKITTLTYGFDVAKGIIALLDHANSLGEIYHITQDESYSWQEILAIYLRVIEKFTSKKPKVLLVDLESTLEIHPAEYQIKYDRLYDRKFNNSKISRYIDTNCFATLDDGLERCLCVFLENPQFRKISWKTEALKDKLTNEHASLKEIKGIRQKIKYLIYRYLK